MAQKKKSAPAKRGKSVQKQLGICAVCTDEQEMQRVLVLGQGMRWRCKKCETLLSKTQKVRTVL